MGRKIFCEVVCPERIVYSEEADMAIVRGVEGELGIMASHVPFVTPLDFGEMRIKRENEEEHIAIMGGYLEFRDDKLTILADVCELCCDIDIERAKQKKEERERQIAEAKLDAEAMLEAEISLKKALLRLKVAAKA